MLYYYKGITTAGDEFVVLGSNKEAVERDRKLDEKFLEVSEIQTTEKNAYGKVIAFAE